VWEPLEVFWGCFGPFLALEIACEMARMFPYKLNKNRRESEIKRPKSEISKIIPASPTPARGMCVGVFEELRVADF